VCTKDKKASNTIVIVKTPGDILPLKMGSWFSLKHTGLGCSGWFFFTAMAINPVPQVKDDFLRVTLSLSIKECNNINFFPAYL